MTTDVTPAPRREAAPAKPAPDRTTTVIVVVLVLGWLAGVLWRLWLGDPITHPIAHTDEDSYMNAARAIAGGPEGFSSETPLFRRIGYPLLVSPAFLCDDPDQARQSVSRLLGLALDIDHMLVAHGDDVYGKAGDPLGRILVERRAF